MRAMWNHVTLMKHATDDDDGRIPPMAPIWCALLAAVIWSVVLTAQWIVQN